jgi:hypothetical protein
MGVDITQKIQIIKTHINEERFYAGRGDERTYYNQLRQKISNLVTKDADIVLINLIPKKPIRERWVVELLLDLQGEFTKTAILPKTEINFSNGEIDEIMMFLKIKNILQSVI